MISLYDRNFKIWYLNPAAKRFLGLNDIPNLPCYTIACNNKTPCPICFAKETFSDSKSHEGIYLNPLGKNSKLKWIYSWTQPMMDEKGIPILLEDNLPLAVLESFQDITDSFYFQNIPLDEKIAVIAKSIYNRDDGFDKIRIYKADPAGETLSLIENVGYSKKLRKQSIMVKDYHNITKSIEHFKETGIGMYFYEGMNPDPLVKGEIMEHFIHWPLMKGTKLLGLLSVSRKEYGRPCTEDKKMILKDYAEEILKAFSIEEKKKDKDSTIEERIASIEEFCIKLSIKKSSPEKALIEFLDEIIKQTNSDEVFIRYRKEIRKERKAILLPYAKGKYYKVAPQELSISLDNRDLPPIRVFTSGDEEINDNATKDNDFDQRMLKFPEAARDVLRQMNSYCIEPLFYRDSCFAILSLYSKNIKHFSKIKIETIRIFANYLSPLVHDFIVSYENKRILQTELQQDLSMRAVHNIRTPVQAISTYLDVLKANNLLDIDSQDIINKIKNQIHRIENLTGDFLSFLRPIELNEDIINLKDFINNLIQKFEYCKNEITINFLPDKRINKIYGDEKELYSVFEELIDNAIKNKATKIKIKIEKQHNYVNIHIEDNGTGISKKLQKTLFRPFTSGDPMGTGLGLSLVRKIIRSHNGFINADFDYEPGAKFIIELPNNI